MRAQVARVVSGTVDQCRSVRTTYPVPSLRTEVTVVWVRTGAEIDFA